MTSPSEGKLPYVLVLAGNSREGRKYAKLAGLPKGRHRVVYSAKQIRTTKRADVHILPSFSRRLDRHGILAALRYCKGERLDVAMPVDVDRDPRGPLTTRQLEVAYRYHGLRETPVYDAVAELAKSEALETPPEAPKGDDQESGEPTDGSAEAPNLQPNESDDAARQVESEGIVRRRRSRCRDCGQLHFPEEDHTPPQLTAAPALTPGNFFGGA